MPPRKKKIIEPANEQAPEPAIEPVIEPVIETEELPEDPQSLVTQEDTVTFKRSHFYAVLTVLAFAAGILLGYVVWGMDSSGATALSPQTANQSAGPANGLIRVTTFLQIISTHSVPRRLLSPLWNSVITNVHSVVVGTQRSMSNCWPLILARSNSSIATCR